MLQTLIEYRPSLFYPPRSGPYIAGKITFVPGVKAYKSEDWEELLSHPVLSRSINNCLEEGIFRVVSRSRSTLLDEEAPPLPTNQAAAVALVKKTYSLSLLQSWQKTETRKVVLEAIALQSKVDDTPTSVPPPKEVSIGGE